tara:strand:+ start:23 stop:1522 length:1500 start_codon:yes stop_codon:yes gene_type:complete
MSENKKIKELIDIRRKKLKNLLENNINPFPHNYENTHSVEALIDNENILAEKNIEVSISGRIVSLRNMGKAAFLNIQGEFQRIQCYLSNKNTNIDDVKYSILLDSIDIGDIVGVKGVMFYTKTNEYSIRISSFEILSKSIRPLPNLKEKDGEAFNSFEDKELRYRHRHLDFIANPERKNIFINRHNIINGFRDFLNKNSYIEAETPVLQPIYGGANARPFTTHHHTLDEKLYLRIAVELYLKRLIIGGFDRVYEISKNFRNEGMDRNHNPEFTMLEFYQAYADVYDMMNLTEEMIREVATLISSDTFIFGEHIIDFSKPFNRITLNELFEKEFNIENLLFKDKELRKIASNLSLDSNLEYGNLIDKIFSISIEPKLVEPTFVLDFPKAISPLSKIKREQTEDIVERFELFIGGMEIANAFTELNDPMDQRERFESQEKLKEKGDDEAQILDEAFLSAMESGMPPTGGVGIGIDRITMILTGQESIKDVIFFPAMRKIKS